MNRGAGVFNMFQPLKFGDHSLIVFGDDGLHLVELHKILALSDFQFGGVVVCSISRSYPLMVPLHKSALNIPTPPKVPRYCIAYIGICFGGGVIG